MKVLFCTNSFEHITNGPAKFANLLLNIESSCSDIEVRILTEDVGVSSKKVYKMDVNYAPIFRYLGQVIRIFLYRKKIQQIQKEYAYDILVFNHAFHGLAISFVDKRPIIGMINDDNSCTKNFSNFALTKDWLSYYIYGVLEKWSIRRFQEILVNSRFLKKELIRSYQLSDREAAKLTLFYKAIELEDEVPAPRAFGARVRILFVKRDFLRGGLDTLTAALRRLTDYTFELTIIGPEERFFDQVDQLTKDLPHVQVHLFSYKDAAAVREAMFEHDIFCVPAHLEALGVANLEALSRGISVVSSDAGGIPEVLDHGRNGWMVAAGDAVALANALSECITNESLRLDKRANGLAYAAQFDVQIMYQRFKHIMDQYAGN
jgi:colanic acid/amylovoran biosynthesis glycosyltransferase